MFGSVESENVAEAEFPVESSRRVSQPVVLFDRSLSKDEDKMRVLGLCYRTRKTGFFFLVYYCRICLSSASAFLFCKSVPESGYFFNRYRDEDSSFFL
jgi:hypothetical protein